ncbi:PAS domain S-box protein [Pelagimonas varians]|uniref:Aerotaxis receptor n=1 Tax=Pelagimonas varians TaxID=696760 RepID=A0A238K4D2_9RHOB|nr:PAS domain S-box protein [Pelagimonas varians]PYG30556.1 aerotaxis receptor [Pelagimonas varians]SMX37317.1 Aerotaxis receptor [Pelagimonas varians]
MTELNPQFTAEAKATSSEALFQVSELFYSRTDDRGVIQSGNNIFQRVSGFEWDELLGAPHKIVRNPDMPKGLFEFMWGQLKAGHTVGAYVKNRRKDGRFYWVFALVSKTSDGYISTRMKPSSELLKTITGIYQEMLAEEHKGMSPKASAEFMHKKLIGLGYMNYSAFQATAIAAEYEARSRNLGRPLDQLQKRFTDMSRAIEQVQTETTEMTEAFKAIRTVPMNMRIIASRLENAGGPISAISVNYSQMLEEMSAWVSTFVDGEACVFARIREAILQGQFLGFAMALEQEMIELFKSQGGTYPENIDLDEEAKNLDSMRAKYLDQTGDALSSVENEAKRFGRSVLDMKRYVTGLSSTRMMCKIESASLSNSGTALSGIVDQLDACQNEIEQRLARIVELNSVIQGNTSMLRSLI